MDCYVWGMKVLKRGKGVYDVYYKGRAGWMYLTLKEGYAVYEVYWTNKMGLAWVYGEYREDALAKFRERVDFEIREEEWAERLKTRFYRFIFKGMWIPYDPGFKYRTEHVFANPVKRRLDSEEKKRNRSLNPIKPTESSPPEEEKGWFGDSEWK